MSEAAFAELPPALLLLGPGSWEAAQGLYERYESACSARVEKLDKASARHVVTQAGIKPFGRSVKVFVICLDGASAESQDTLLAVLEKPPEAVRFILASVLPPLKTVISRCQVLVQGAARDEQDPQDAKTRQMVATAVRAARDHHAALLDAAMASWGDEHTEVLFGWAGERAADRWVTYPADLVGGVSAREAMVILTVLSAYPGARTAPRVALDRAFQR